MQKYLRLETDSQRNNQRRSNIRLKFKRYYPTKLRLTVELKQREREREREEERGRERERES